MKELQLDWMQILMIALDGVGILLDQHKAISIFEDGNKTVMTYHAILQMKGGPPKFCKTWPVRFAIKDSFGVKFN